MMMAACKVTLTGVKEAASVGWGGKAATWFWVAEVLLAVEAASAVDAALPVVALAVVVLLVVVVPATALVLWLALGAVATAGFALPGFRLGTFSGQGVATTTGSGAGAGAGAGWAATGSGAGSGV
jgi:hypothetical protein